MKMLEGDFANNLFERYSSVVIGPGLGTSDEARELVCKIIRFYAGPLVVDADAINVLNHETDKELIAGRKAPILFTPHSGEFSRFLGITKEEARVNPLDRLKELVEDLGCSVLLIRSYFRLMTL